MNVVFFETELQAIQYSNDYAIAKGCSGVTSYWWPIRKHSNGKYAVLVGNSLDTVDDNGNEVLGDGVVKIDESDLL